MSGNCPIIFKNPCTSSLIFNACILEKFGRYRPKWLRTLNKVFFFLTSSTKAKQSVGFVFSGKYCITMSGETRNVAVEESKVGSQNLDDTLVVLEFSPKAPAETKEWLTALIKAPGVLFRTLRKLFLWER